MLKNQLKTILLLGSLSALLVGVGSLVAPNMLGLFAVLAIVMNVGAYFFSDRLVLRMHRAAEVSPAEAPSLHAMVSELAVAAGIPKPRVFLIPEEQPNAFATGRNPSHGVVAVTDGIVRLLDERELRGVLAHEIAHIKNRDILLATVAATMAGILSYLGQALTFGAFFGGGRDDEESGHGGLLAAIVAPLAAMLVQMAISRSREYLADETGARLSRDPAALARALVKLERGVALVPAQASPATASLFIVNPFGAVEQLSRLFSTHPSTDERVRRLLAMADSTEQLRQRSWRPSLLGEL
jgi:heat shock protein HtpX